MKTIEERFWSKVIGRDGCLLWVARRNPTGYGEIIIDGKKRLAHRVAWKLATGEEPGTMCVLHRCDNPPCVLFSHLFLGTQADNVADMRAKGRERHPGRCKLSVQDVIDIRNYRRDGVPVTSLAARFAVHPATINSIARGRYRSEVPFGFRAPIPFPAEAKLGEYWS